MCGRYLVTSPDDDLAEVLRVPAEDLAAARPRPRWNAAPSQALPVARVRSTGDRTVEAMTWGLVPGWTKDPAQARRPINARAETAAERPSFRAAMKRRRAAIPTDGFYEWQAREHGPKQPWLFRRRDGRPLLLAGIWEHWRPKDAGEGDPETPWDRTFAILTMPADAQVAPVHDRMPVVLEEADLDRWLDPGSEDPDLEAILAEADEARLEGVPVSRHVNSPKHDDPDCARPVDEGSLFDGTDQETPS